METIKIKNGKHLEFDEVVVGISKLNSKDLGIFFNRINYTIIGKKKTSKLGEEAILLKQIKEIIPASIVRQYNILLNKQLNNKITEKEKEEILIIADFIEEKSAERIPLLGKLAKIRNTTITTLVRNIEFKNFNVKCRV